MTNEQRYIIPAGLNCLANGLKGCEHVHEDQWDCGVDYYCSLIENNNALDSQYGAYLGKGEHTPNHESWWLPKCKGCLELCPNGGTLIVTTTTRVEES